MFPLCTDQVAIADPAPEVVDMRFRTSHRKDQRKVVFEILEFITWNVLAGGGVCASLTAG